MHDLPPLHELLAHTHLLTERQRRQGSIGPVGPLLCVHAEGMRDGAPVAVDRFFADKASPNAALLALRGYGPEADHLLFVVDAPPERQQAFVRAGFRLVETQWLMACTLDDWPPPENEKPLNEMPLSEMPLVDIRRAVGAGDALAINAIDGLEAIPFDDIDDPALVHYYCLTQERSITYGRWAGYDEANAWVSHVHTAPSFRGRGYATALMERILTDNKNAGIERSLLLATGMARELYKRLGYREIAPVAILQAPPALLRRRNRRS